MEQELEHISIVDTACKDQAPGAGRFVKNEIGEDSYKHDRLNKHKLVNKLCITFQQYTYILQG